MPIDLVRVERLDTWEGVAGSPTVWIVRGTTIEDRPFFRKMRTANPLYASLCDRALKTDRLVWVGWRDGRHGNLEMTTVRLDDTKFEHEATA
jgi:hypothetical protein